MYTIHIHNFSRLARSTKDLIDIVKMLNAKGVMPVSNKENIITGKLTTTSIIMLKIYRTILSELLNGY